MAGQVRVRYARSLSPADVGCRVSVRRRLPDGRLGDVLGVLTAWTERTAARPGALRIQRKDGTTVTVAEDALVAGKVVPPPPVIARTHAAVGVGDLEEVAALGWQGTHTTRLGGWLLRAAGGWTGRANSVLPLGEPDRPVEEALAAVRAWYAGHGTAAWFQVPLPLAGDLDEVLSDDGWSTGSSGIGGIHMMTGDCAAVLDRTGPAPADLPPVRLRDTPTPGWLATYRYRGGELPQDAVAVLTNARAPVFAEVVADGATLAVGRASVDRGWVGITAMEVAESARHRGLGRHVLTALIAHGRAAGARHVYLQVEGSNAAAVGLYGGLGLTLHHRYHYRLDSGGLSPAGGRPDETSPGEAAT